MSSSVAAPVIIGSVAISGIWIGPALIKKHPAEEELGFVVRVIQILGTGLIFCATLDAIKK